MKHFILILLSVLLFQQALYSQDSANLSGLITDDESGEVLIGVNILIYTDSLRTEAPLRGATTNKYGFYSVPYLDAGIYYMFVSSIGYQMQSFTIRLVSGENVRQDVQLHKEAIELEEVVVEDRKETDFTETTSTIEVQPELIKQLPSIGGETDLFRALQLLPGVTNATELSTGMYVRGGSADQNLTIIDGVVVYNPSHLGGFASTFNADALQNIQLIKGAYPAEYGGRLSSVLDVTMREGTKKDFHGTANINSISTRMTIEGPLENDVTYIFSGRTMYLDKILPAIPNTDKFPAYSFTDFNGKVNYVISETDRIFISGFFSSDLLKEPRGSNDVGFNIDWSNATLNLTWTKITSPTLFTKTSLMYTRYDFSTLITDKKPDSDALDFYTSSLINDILVKTEVQLNLNESHFIKGGAELVHHDFSTTTSDFFIKEFEYKPDRGRGLQSLETSVFLQDEWQIFEDLKGNFGARMIYFESADLLEVEPRASLTYYLMDRLLLRGSYAIAHQPLHLLSRDDVYLPTDVWYPSTKAINPARSEQYSIGMEATSVDRSFLFTAEGYFKNMQNLYMYKENADFSYESAFDEQLTRGSGEAYGVEFFLNKRLGIFTGWIGYTLSWTRRHFSELNKGDSFYPRYDRRHDISVVATIKPIKDLDIGISWTYSTGQAFSLPIMQYGFQSMKSPDNNSDNIYYEYSTKDAYRLPDFHKLDISCNYKFELFDTHVTVSLNVYNVYNRYNVFSKYIGYKTDEQTGEDIPVIKQFTLYPVLPTLGITFDF